MDALWDYDLDHDLDYDPDLDLDYDRYDLVIAGSPAIGRCHQ